MRPHDEPDPDLASELRQGPGREWMEEAAEDERLTELLRRRQRSLSEVLGELGARGDRVSVEFGGHSFSGVIEAVGSDFAIILGPGQVADIRLAVARWSRIPTGDSAPSSDLRQESFVGRLKGFEADGTTLRLALPGQDFVIGRIAVVAVDHVEVADVDERRLYIPLGQVLAAIRSTDAQ